MQFSPIYVLLNCVKSLELYFFSFCVIDRKKKEKKESKKRKKKVYIPPAPFYFAKLVKWWVVWHPAEWSLVSQYILVTIDWRVKYKQATSLRCLTFTIVINILDTVFVNCCSLLAKRSNPGCVGITSSV